MATAKPRRGFLRRQMRRIELTDAAGLRTTVYVLIASTLLLTAFGFVMVLSSSAVEFVSADRDPYSLFIKQATFGVMGIVGMFVMMAMPTAWLKRLAWIAMIGMLGLLALVLVIGVNVNGNKNWLQFGPVTLQPSEMLKPVMVLFAGTMFERKRRVMDQPMHALVPVAVVVGMAIALVLLGRDLGQVLVLAGILAVMYLVSGAPWRVMGLLGAAGLAMTVVAVFASPNRMMRILSFAGQGAEDDAQGIGFQALQGRFALASGGWTGVGLGQSRLKWSYIPEAQNDFIVAIIGEEIGLWGTLTIIAAFMVMIVCIYRIGFRGDSLFSRVVCGGVMAWIGFQAFVNIGMVSGMLPVIGVPLPFISYGGSALLSTLIGVGLVLNIARTEIMASQRAKFVAASAAEEDAYGSEAVVHSVAVTDASEKDGV